MDKQPKIFDKPRNYFEGVLQLRNPSQQIVDYVISEINKVPHVWIAKSVELDNGIDLLLSSNTFLRQIGKKLKERFPGDLKLTSSIHTRNYMTQKDVHRGCVLFRHYDIKAGDKFVLQGEEMEVMRVGAQLLCKSLESGKKVHIRFDQLKDARF
ncbi:MAG: NMD3-related protein [Nanoarchaeota archaeon]|nr:NMD3-related protein [Nanoarchaeota archaeon]